MLTVKVNRDLFHMQTSNYQLKNEGPRTVLEVLQEIQCHHDPTLAFRYSCRTGLCATCIILINDKPAKSCLKKAEPGEDGVLYLSPLPNVEHYKDLVSKIK